MQCMNNAGWTSDLCCSALLFRLLTQPRQKIQPVMQLQSFSIMDACSLNPTALCFWYNLTPSLQYIPEEPFTMSVMSNTSPPSVSFTTPNYTLTPTRRQVGGSLMLTKNLLGYMQECFLSCFRCLRAWHWCSPAITKSSRLNGLKWNV